MSTPSARARFVLLVSVGLALALVFLCSLREGWPLARELASSRWTGFLSLAVLLLALAITPVARLTRRRGWARNAPWAGLRRMLGITSALLALLHAAITVGATGLAPVGALWAVPHLRAGALALLVLIPLFLSSFATVARRIRLWKELHRLAYVAALVAVLHLLLSPFAPLTATMVVLYVSGVLLASRLI